MDNICDRGRLRKDPDLVDKEIHQYSIFIVAPWYNARTMLPAGSIVRALYHKL